MTDKTPTDDIAPRLARFREDQGMYHLLHDSDGTGGL